MSSDHMFCPMCGSILQLLVDVNTASCAACRFTRSFEDFEGIEVAAASTPEDWLVRYAVEGVPAVGEEEQETKRQRATVNEKCPKCAHDTLEFYTMQLRSVDEGATVFYECPKCRHKFSQNN